MNETQEWADYGIKLREKGAKAWAFLTPRGGSVRLKIHAARFTRTNAAAEVVKLAADNPSHDFKAVVL